MFLIPNKDHLCPFCGNNLGKPTRKKQCPKCGNVVFVRTIPSTRKQVWVSEEGRNKIEAEWTEYFEKQSKQEAIKMQKDWFVDNRNKLNQFRKEGIVKTFKIYSCEDDMVCPICSANHGKIIPIESAEVGKNLPPFKDCQNSEKNPYRCRCYFTPEDISIN